MEFPDELEESQAAVMAGGRCRHPRVRNAYTMKAAVSWWFQPG